MHPLSADAEAMHLHRLMDSADIDEVGLHGLTTQLFAGRAVKRAIDGEPMRARIILEEELKAGRALAVQPRRELVRGLQEQFGLDACIRQLSYMGYRMPGVELSNRMTQLGDQPSIRLDSREVFRERPQLIHDLYAVLSGERSVSDSTLQSIVRMVGLGAQGGTLSLHADDGTEISRSAFAGTTEEAELASPAP